MKFKGFTGTLAKHLSYRLSKPGDVLADGSDIDECSIAVVHKKDCPTYEKDGTTYIDPQNAPAIADMSGHSTTKMVYGCWKKRKADNYRGVILESGERIFDETYFTCNVYFGNRGRIYKASMKRKNTPEMEAKFQIQEIENSEKRSTSYEEKLDIQLLLGAITRDEHDSLLSRFQEINKTLA